VTLKLPGQYAKFITALGGNALVYLYTYGWAWHIKEAAILAAVALGVYGIPNTPKPAAVLPVVPPTGNVTITPPAV
jgi:hypothetical protein